MKNREIKDLHTKAKEELEGMCKSAKAELLELNLSKAQNKLKNTRSIFWKKKDIARILTILRQKEFVKALPSAGSK